MDVICLSVFFYETRDAEFASLGDFAKVYPEFT